MKELRYCATLKSIGLFCILHGSILAKPDFFFFFLTSCIGHLENVGSLNYVEFPKVIHFIL